jgi:hypothetical protein
VNLCGEESRRQLIGAVPGEAGRGRAALTTAVTNIDIRLYATERDS